MFAGAAVSIWPLEDTLGSSSKDQGLQDDDGDKMLLKKTAERHAFLTQSCIKRLCASLLIIQQPRGRTDTTASASKSNNKKKKKKRKLTAITLSRSTYFSSVLKLCLHDVFSPVCLCVEFHQASEEGG